MTRVHAQSQQSAEEHDHEPDDEHDRGLSYDLSTLLSRRRALTLFSGAGLAAALAACGGGSEGSSTAGSTSSGTASPTGSGSASAGATESSAAGSTAEVTTEIPEETAGPFPGDGSNGVNVLSESGIVRSDITRSFGSASGAAAGVPLTVKLRVLDIDKGAAGLEGAAVYLWHCTPDGRYSLYSEGVTEENYLRGVQAADVDGWVTFTSVYPGAYAGRWPHIHFEVYPSVRAATTSSEKLRTTQLALPEKASRLAYATDGYGQSVQNLAQSSLESDNVFSDGYSLQLARVTGNVSNGMTATLNVPV